MNRVEEHEERMSTADLAGAAGSPEPGPGPLLPPDFIRDLQTRWDQVQTGFVDQPRSSVQQADELVAMTIRRLAESFALERKSLEEQWARGDEANTEDLRIALQKYRSFFHRLLSV